MMAEVIEDEVEGCLHKMINVGMGVKDLTPLMILMKMILQKHLDDLQMILPVKMKNDQALD